RRFGPCERVRLLHVEGRAEHVCKVDEQPGEAARLRRARGGPAPRLDTHGHGWTEGAPRPGGGRARRLAAAPAARLRGGAPLCGPTGRAPGLVSERERELPEPWTQLALLTGSA